MRLPALLQANFGAKALPAAVLDGAKYHLVPLRPIARPQLAQVAQLAFIGVRKLIVALAIRNLAILLLRHNPRPRPFNIAANAKPARMANA